MEAKATARSISSLFITMTHIYVTQIGVENRSEKSLLLAEYLHVKSVLTDSFPQTDGPTYGRYWPSSHSRQGSCAYSCLIFAPSSGCSIVLVRQQWFFKASEAERTRAVQVASLESKLPIQLK